MEKSQNIMDYMPKVHPTKAVFTRYCIPVAAVARFLGLSTSYTCGLLNGFVRVSPENDQKLRGFAQMVELEAKEAR